MKKEDVIKKLKKVLKDVLWHLKFVDYLRKDYWCLMSKFMFEERDKLIRNRYVTTMRKLPMHHDKRSTLSAVQEAGFLWNDEGTNEMVEKPEWPKEPEFIEESEVK